MPLSEVKNIDCMEGMRDYPDKYFDLAIVDPPYGIGHTNNKGENNLAKTNPDKMPWNKTVPEREYFTELFRISSQQIIWGVNYYPYDFLAGGRIVWDKLTTGDFSACEIAYCSLQRTVTKFQYLWNGMIQQNNRNREIRIHPTQKPLALYKWLLKNYAKPGDKILDTHLGSGSSRIAAYDMGFDFTAFEIDADYFDAQEKRFQQFKAQTKLFV